MKSGDQKDSKIEQIIKFADQNHKSIDYTVVEDILRDKNDRIDEKQIEQIVYNLLQRGYNIVQREADEDYQADEVEPELFVPADVNISQNPLNIYNLMERLENDEIELSPEFQRHANLWSYEKQSRLIESLMLKIPIPAFYFDASDEEKWVIIDGLQRLSAFQNYLVGIWKGGEREKRSFSGLQFLKDFNGMTVDQLPRQYVRRIKETPIIAYTVEKGTPDAVVFNIFQRINTGGEGLNDQEIRQALYSGKATRLIQKLAGSEAFLKATGNAVKTERMQDREYVTRFIAFTELDYRKYYRGNIDNYLIRTLKCVNSYEDIKLNKIEDSFERVMNYCYEIFGVYAFRKYNMEWRRGPINKAIFEMWSVCFSNCEDMKLKQIVRNKEKFLTEFQRLLQNTEFVSALKSGDQYSTCRRIDMATRMVKEFVC